MQLHRLVFLALGLPAAIDAQSQNHRVDSLMKTEMAKAGVPGASVVIMRDGKVLHHGSYGLASIELGVPVTEKTVFPLASITKVFTAAAVMTLVEQGQLSLDDDVRMLLPELPAAWSGVKVHHLLGHTSGLPDVVVNPVTGVWLGENRDDALTRLAAIPMPAKPGTEWSYNQTNYMLLGMIAEKLSGSPFDSFLRESVIKPLALEGVVYGDSKAIVPDRGSWYSIIDFSEGRPKRAKAPSVAWVTYPTFVRTAAGLNATALDVARFAEALSDGKLLRSATTDKMWTAVKLADGNTFRMEKTLGVGLGWIVNDVPGHRSVGGTGGSAAAFRHYRDDNLTVVVLTNLQGIDPDALVDAVAALYVPALAAQ